jgi:peptidoglycan/xylan/chitin deacetylase (PgdA/CDA1 family)
VSLSGAYRTLCVPLGRMRGGFILAYHNPPAERFVEQIESLVPSQPVALDELVERHAAGAPTGGLFAITFDDGVGDTVRAIAAVAVERQWPVSFYLPTRYLDEPGGLPFQWLRAIERYAPAVRVEVAGATVDFTVPGARREFAKRMAAIMYSRPFGEYAPLLGALRSTLAERGLVEPAALAAPAPISWSEVEALARNPLLGFESHGVSHTALSALDADELERELIASQRAIADRTARACRHFCYPYGGPASIGSAAPAAVTRHYRSATTMSRGRLGRHELALLPRVPVYPHDDADLVRLKVLTA